MAEEKIIADEQPTKLWEMYQNGLAYQRLAGLSSNIPTFVNFFEGRQWPAPTKNTKNLPRPVVNIVKLICRNKKSAILSTPVKLVYKAEDENVDTDKFTNFADYIQKEIRQEELDAKAIDDGVKKGSYFYHYYWDSEAKGKDGVKEGGLRCEIIDILDIFFSNPMETDEQKQEWILIASREVVKAVREKADTDIDKDLISADESEKKYGEREQEGTELCTVLTRYFRKDGEVYCEKATKGTIINKPFALTPDEKSVAKLMGFNEDAPNNSLPDTDLEEPKKDVVKMSYFPIVVGSYEEREKSIYGIGEVEGLIPNQKAINFNLAMFLLNCEQLAWGKWRVAPDALKGQLITNEPGQVLIDHSKTGNGISRLEAQQLNAAPLSIADKIMEYTRVVTGSTEVMTGEVISANMSGAAIAQLQSQAQQPIDELRDRFWRVKEKQGRIYEQYFKTYYSYDKEFSYPDTEKVLDEKTGQKVDKEIQVPDVFNGEEFQDTEFSIVVEATAGTKSSAAGDINALDTLLAKGMISLKTYLKAYPKNALSNRTEIIKGIEDDEQGEVAQLKQQVMQYEQQVAQATQIIQQQKETVDKVVALIQDNNQLRTVIANLYAEGKQKILEGNQQVSLANSKIQETTQDATEFAKIIAQIMQQQGGAQGMVNLQQGGNANAMSQMQGGNENQKSNTGI